MRNEDLKLSRHHIVCKSIGGGDGPDNVVMIKQGLHRKYHSLFGNKHPSEILEFLENYFWGGNTDFIANYFWREENECAN